MSKKALIMSGMLLLVVVAVSIAYIGVKAKTNIPVEAAVSTVLEQYNGEVLAASLAGQFYVIKLKSATGLYEVKVDADGGGIYEIAELERYVAENGGTEGQMPTASPSPQATSSPQATPSPSEDNGSNIGTGNPTDGGIVTDSPQPSAKPSTKPSTKPSAKPTEKPSDGSSSSSPSALITEKKAIELALAQVAGVVEEVELERSGNKRYYLVEIETAEGKEAQVQINAASGKVMSITWGEDDDEDDD